MDTNSKFLANPRNNNGELLHMHLDMQMQATTSSSSESGEAKESGRWASKVLRECAAAMAAKESAKIQHLLWMLNELASPYGDLEQKLAAYFLQALFCKATESGPRCLKTLASVAERAQSFESARRVMLKFQEVSPWTTFGHVACNGATLEALEGAGAPAPVLHIIDMSTTLCTQWPTLLEAVATRSDDTPRLRLTVVATSAAAKAAMREISPRMEKFARLMGVPLEFTVIAHLARLADLTKDCLAVRPDEAVAVNCVGSLSRAAVQDRKGVIDTIRSLNPRIVTIVEEEADLSSNSNSNREDFVECFEECLRFHTLYLEMLEESFPPTSNEKLMLERDCARSIVRVLACDDADHSIDDSGRREKGRQWAHRMREAGFSALAHSDDVVDDVRALLKRYRPGCWSLSPPPGEDGIYLAWKEDPVVWASVWKPSTSS